MERLNQTSSVSEFILLGLSSWPEDQKPLFILFLIMYLVTITGNLLIILAIRSDPQLQTPMYFFLSFLSFIDICFSTTIVPRVLVNFLSEKKTISYAGCLAQMYFTYALGNTDTYLLAAMAYDRYVGIHHFLCDINPLLKLSCSSIFVNDLTIKTEGLVFWVTPFLCIVFSYVRILVAVLRIPSAAGKRKAFSTCGSHFTVVILFYGSIFYVYLQPLSSYTVQDQVATIVYTVLTSMLNPFIYSLRNKDMKRGLGKLMGRRKT
nr:PREDICTED: olfactory receptor 1L8 [Bos mutus]